MTTLCLVDLSPSVQAEPTSNVDHRPWIKDHCRRIVHKRCLSERSFESILTAAFVVYRETRNQFEAIRVARETADALLPPDPPCGTPLAA